MKVFFNIVAALAAIAGIVFVVVAYGDKIVAWAKKTWKSCKCHCGGNCKGECTCDGECDCDDEVVAEVVTSAADEVVAAETDFEG